MECSLDMAAGIIWTMLYTRPPFCPPRLATDELVPQMTRLLNQFCPEHAYEILRLRLDMKSRTGEPPTLFDLATAIYPSEAPHDTLAHMCADTRRNTDDTPLTPKVPSP